MRRYKKTIWYTNKSKTYTFSLSQLKKRKQQFLAYYARSYVDSLTKPNLNLDLKRLRLAMLIRRNIRSLTKFMLDLITYDNRFSISNIYTINDYREKMSSFTERYLKFIVGHILF